MLSFGFKLLARVFTFSTMFLLFFLLLLFLSASRWFLKRFGGCWIFSILFLFCFEFRHFVSFQMFSNYFHLHFGGSSFSMKSIIFLFSLIVILVDEWPHLNWDIFGNFSVKFYWGKAFKMAWTSSATAIKQNSNCCRFWTMPPRWSRMCSRVAAMSISLQPLESRFKTMSIKT